MNIMDYMERYDYEQLVICTDKGVGLRAIIAIHDTTLGPALGGVRMWPYESEEAAITDALRLARGMTYKAAVAGLNLGGGKAVVIGDPAKDKSEALFWALGRFVESLNGRYIATEDVGITVEDVELIATQTSHVTGLSPYLGSSGDPSPATAVGVHRGIRACAQEVYGSESLNGKRIAIQGVGKVGYRLAKHLQAEEAVLVVTDMNERLAARVKEEFGATVVAPPEIYDVECDIFSPCALGAIINDDTIPRLKCKIVAGAANNQLAEERHGDELHQRGILYAPDYVINGGGLINLSFELTRYDAEAAMERVAAIHDTIAQVIAVAKAQGISTAKAADKLADDRIAAARRVKNMYLG